MIGLETWFGGGQRVPLMLPDNQPVHLFCRVSGSGQWVTFLHGFPTCSWDWATVADSLGSDYRVLLPDLLGYGDSDKPSAHKYSLVEAADSVERLWRHFGVRETRLVAHDIGGSVAQELLARQLEARLAVQLTRVVFLNAALYHGLSRPRPVQRLLSHRVIGPVLSRVVTERVFARNLAATFSTSHPLASNTAHDYWTALRRRSTSPHIHRLLRYIPERAQHHVRWESALDRTAVPLSFIWGLHDPVSGAPVANEIRQRLPRADFVGLDDVGHYPHVEVPDRVLTELRTLL